MKNSSQPVGVLAVQGDFELHARMLERIGAAWKLVKDAADLSEVSALIMPGGESAAGTALARPGFFAATRPLPAVNGACLGRSRRY